ncbi:MAG TPA: invasion associated locus B family protein [Microvirga sp.]|jgi:Invasion associated locus B (IalB) protein|nr:invasion associated locus B family protein [Microvirga sp.]
MILPLARNPLGPVPGPSLLALTLAAPLLAIVIGPAHGQSAQAQRPAATPAKPAGAAAQPSAARPGAASNPLRPGAAKPASPAAKPAATAAVPGGASATVVATFADWSVYTAQTGRSKICYALTQPKDRAPKNLNRDPAYLFVSFRPAQNIRNEVALVMGFAAKADAPAEAVVGNASYALLTQAQNAWLKNPAEESQAISTMTRGQNLTVKVQSQRGNQLTDRYSLNGFGQALERARKECS